MATVSVIIPVYNSSRYLQETLESVLTQSFKDWICICVDDGSTDNSREILEQYRITDSRFLILS